MPWSTLSNAFKKLRYTMSTEPPPSNMCMMSSKTFSKADRQDRPLLNSCCVLFGQPFLSISNTISYSLAYNSFMGRTIRLSNYFPKLIRCTPSCSVYSFKHLLDTYFTNIVDHPYIAGLNNSLDGGDCIKWKTLRDDQAAN